MNGELEIIFDWHELMMYGQGERKQNFIKSLMEIGGTGGYWNGYTNTLILKDFPQSRVPDARDWLDANGFTEADVTFREETGCMIIQD